MIHGVAPFHLVDLCFCWPHCGGQQKHKCGLEVGHCLFRGCEVRGTGYEVRFRGTGYVVRQWFSGKRISGLACCSPRLTNCNYPPGSRPFFINIWFSRAKVVKTERNTKGKLVFLCISRSAAFAVRLNGVSGEW